MISPKIKKLAKAKADVERLEILITEELASLHEGYGFDSVETFIIALKTAGRGGTGRKAKLAARKRRRRAKITDATRAKVGKLVKAGRTASHIAKALKISLPSVANIKKALGLTRSSKKPARKPKARRAPAKPSAVPKARKKRVAAKKPATSESKPAQTPAETKLSPSV